MSVPAFMRALQQTSLNGPRDLRMITDAPVPVPGRGEILIRVAAGGINMADISQAYGKFRAGPQPPYIAGFEGVGEVVALGEGVTTVAPGAHVIGVGYGAFADYMVLPAMAAVPVPKGWSDEQALGLVVNLPTAVAALKLLGQIENGETVLIHAAAGATGQAAVKIAKHYGATVIAAASSESARSCSPWVPITSSTPVPPISPPKCFALTGNVGADLVIESVGGETFEASLASARRVTGRVVVTGLPAGEAALTNWDLVYKHQVHIIGFNMGVLIRAAPQMFGAVMGEMFALIGAGILSPVQPTVYELADGPKALAALEGRSSVGKLALRL